VDAMHAMQTADFKVEDAQKEQMPENRGEICEAIYLLTIVRGLLYRYGGTHTGTIAQVYAFSSLSVHSM
jgi:hypothetical protein